MTCPQPEDRERACARSESGHILGTVSDPEPHEPPATAGIDADRDDLAPLITGVKAVLRSGGLPIRPTTAPEALLELDGVTARSVRPDDRLSRVDALDRLLHRELKQLGLSEWRSAAGALFGIGRSSGTLTDRRHLAAGRLSYEIDHFRKRIEPKIVEQLAWQLERDSLQYVRRRHDGRPLTASGDTPTISLEHIESADEAEREALTSEVWAGVYALRAALIRREVAAGDPDRAEEHQRSAERARWRLGELLVVLDQFFDRYGSEILHGAAGFNAEGLIRLAGWTGEVSVEEATELRWRVTRMRE